MIVSASRRTDIPAFYGEWLLRRLAAGEVLVRNPMNAHDIGRIALAPEAVSCLVLWSKNPAPLLPRLGEMERLGYRHFYFLFTLNPYGPEVEAALPPLAQRISTFRSLAERLGGDRVLWRYDPIFLNRRYTAEFHLSRFADLATALAGATERVIVSFVEMYRKCHRAMRDLAPESPAADVRTALLARLADIAAARGITLQGCAMGDEEAAVVPAGQCIDEKLIAAISGRPVALRRDRNQRPRCRCHSSVDIGAYDSCPHGCRYCYATRDSGRTGRNFAGHDPASPLLLGKVGPQDVIRERSLAPVVPRQPRLF